MPFGAKPVQTGETQQAAGERYELRDLLITDGQPKKTQTGKNYWRVMDEKEHWYSVWDTNVKGDLETAADDGQRIPCAVQIKPGSAGKAPFYTIVAAGPHAAHAVEEGNAKAAASAAPGSRNSEFGKRMHPADVPRVTALAVLKQAITMAHNTFPDMPEKTSCDEWQRRKTLEYYDWLMSIVANAKLPDPGESALTPEPVKKRNGKKTAEQPPADDYTPAAPEDDIPF